MSDVSPSVVGQMDSALKPLVDEWLQIDRNPSTHAEVEALVKKEDFVALGAILKNRMEFGTAGLRSAMGAGFARMNDVTVIGAAQGIAERLTQRNSKADLAERGIVIGYDARHNSQRFAQLSANVFVNAGIKTYLFREHCATPFVPFAVLRYRCLAGVMVTASHNPKQDNGYKVYWENGAQIIPPIDVEISDCIKASYVPKESSWVTVQGTIDPFDDVSTNYFSSMQGELKLSQEMRQSSPLLVCYTPMHGVGTRFVLDALRVFGFPMKNWFNVEKQAEPDPEFPTVTFPNPEEGADALDLAIQNANANNCSLILANDPDVDRLAVAEKTSNGWRLFTGNEIGALFGWWIMRCYVEQHGKDSLSKCWMLSSTVSSMILKTMAAKEGFNFEDTLTGFKWMGSRAAKIGSHVLFAFEEAIGFMCGARVLDKDGITALAVLLECATWLALREKKSLTDQLNIIYEQYGKHFCANSYVISRNPVKTMEMFDAVRSKGSYPQQIGGLNVLGVRDLTTCYDSRSADHKPRLPCSSSSNMITFFMEKKITFTLRSSGTEPKLKWYSEIISDQPDAQDVLNDFMKKVVDTLIRPSFYGFETRN